VLRAQRHRSGELQVGDVVAREAKPEGREDPAESEAAAAGNEAERAAEERGWPANRNVELVAPQRDKRHPSFCLDGFFSTRFPGFPTKLLPTRFSCL
jgi:hypothetical protein